jgi:hypothetical protein
LFEIGMADFYPLLSRAIASLPDNTPEARQSLYERARSVLLSQLRSLDPPLPEADIARERLALEDVIRRLEDQQSGVAEPSWTEEPLDEHDARGHPAPSFAEERADVTSVETAEYGRRPRLDVQRAKKIGGGRNLVVVAIFALVIGGIAGLAYWVNKINREQTPAMAAPEQPAQENERKISERIGGLAPGQPGGSPQQQGQSPAQQAPGQQPGGQLQPPAQQQALAPPVQPDIAGGQRAVLYEEQPGGQQQATALQGRAVWRLDSANVAGSQRLDKVVRADVDIPAAGMTLSFIIRRNTDNRLPASHTIEMTFGKAQGGEGRTIKDVGVPQFKTDETARGTPLAGVPVQVADNFFLVGLSNLPSDLTRNVDLLRSRSWIDIPILYDNKRRGVLAIEKGSAGEQTINEALALWQTQ